MRFLIMNNSVMLNRIKRFFVSLFTTKNRKGVSEAEMKKFDNQIHQMCKGFIGRTS